MPRLAIHDGTPVRTHPLPGIADPAGRTLGDEERRQVLEVLDSARLNRGVGTKVLALEQRFAEKMGVPHCTASTSGTAAIHVALGALNPEPGSEIITGPVTDMGTIIPILLQNCIPVFADLERHSLGLDAADVARRITSRTVAIMPVHLMGIATDLAPLIDLSARHDLRIIEDSSQAYGTTYRGRPAGVHGVFGTFSLQQSKHITCGDGGLTITSDPALGERAALFANKGWPNYGVGGRDYTCFGHNYRMTELQAAVALAQIDRLDGVVAKRIKIAEGLLRVLANAPELCVPQGGEGSQCSYWYLPVLVDQASLGVATGRLAAALQAEGIACGAHYIGRPIYLYDMLRKQSVYGTSEYPWSLQPEAERIRYEPGDTPETDRILDDLLLIHINEGYTEADEADIADALTKVLEAIDDLRDLGDDA